MKILFTGASSFTGSWFVRELARAGHEVVATFRKRPGEYTDPVRRKRVAQALEVCQGVTCSFGDTQFLELARRGCDLLCHHAADVTDYKNPAFDAVAALQNNTRNIAAVVDALCAGGGTKPKILVTGSVFENDEGAGSGGLPAFSPYGLSKGLTWQIFRYYAGRAGLGLGKFVVPNPFGPYEEPRFTAYLMKTWFAGQTAAVSTPLYVRDNIHVSLLAGAYARFAAELSKGSGTAFLRPSGYPESQGAFAARFAAEMRRRLHLACELELKVQTDFSEPRVRINTDPVDGAAWGWHENEAWDAVAEYYEQMLRPQKTAANR